MLYTKENFQKYQFTVGQLCDIYEELRPKLVKWSKRKFMPKAIKTLLIGFISVLDIIYEMQTGGKVPQ